MVIVSLLPFVAVVGGGGEGGVRVYTGIGKRSEMKTQVSQSK